MQSSWIPVGTQSELQLGSNWNPIAQLEFNRIPIAIQLGPNWNLSEVQLESN